MATAQQSVRPAGGGWWRAVLVVGLGGALFTFLNLWVVQGVGQLLSGGRVFPVNWIGISALLIGALISGVLAFGALALLGYWGRGCLILGIWLVGYLVSWLVGVGLGGLTLPIYLLIWLVFGGVVGALASEQLRPRPASARSAHTVTRTSQFGRIPAQTVVLLTQQVRQVQGSIVAALPGGAPPTLRAWTTRAVLDCTLRDWWENSNTDGLQARDVDDLRSFVQQAVALAGAQQLNAQEGQAVYRAALRALLDDWLKNWNANGVEGPPRRG